VVATGGNRSQIACLRNRRNQAKTVAVGCDRLPQSFDGKEGVDGSSPSEGLAKPLQIAGSLLRQLLALATKVAPGRTSSSFVAELSRNEGRP